ncbi:MAG TPA: hypothetical protein PKM88_08200 [bacterium]|nr:hypothetical protein [bacterium]
MAHRTLALLLLFCTLAVVKACGLGAQSFWIDEGHTWHDAMAGDLLHPQGTTPLWTAVEAAALRTGPGWPAELALRLPALICGLAALAILTFACPLPTPAARRTVLLLAGTHPLLYWHDQDARMYSLLFLCATLLVTAVLRLTAGRPRGMLPLAFVAAVAGCYTHPYMLVLAGSAVLWFWFRPDLLTRQRLVLTVLTGVLALLPLGVAYGATVVRYGTAGVAGAPVQRLPDVLLALLQALFGATTFSRQHLPLFTLIGLPVALFAAGCLFWRGLLVPQHRFLLMLSLFPAAVTLLAGTLGFVAVLPRYFIIALPALLLLCAGAAPHPATRIALLITLIFNGIGIWHYRTDPRFGKEDWRTLAATAGDAVSRGVTVGMPGEPPHVFRYYAGTLPVITVGDPAVWLTTTPAGDRLLLLYHGFRRYAEPWRSDPRFAVSDVSRFVLVRRAKPLDAVPANNL